MKINMDNAPKFPNEGLEIGNVYRCKGGATQIRSSGLSSGYREIVS